MSDAASDMTITLWAVQARREIMDLLQWVDGLDTDEAVEVPALRDRLSVLRGMLP